MNIGKLRISWGKKAKDIEFIGISFFDQSMMENQKKLKKRLIEDKFEIVHQYEKDDGVMFFLAKF